MSPSKFHPTLLSAMVSGACAGAVGAVAQVAVGFLLSRYFLPRRQDNNIAPRFIGRVFQKSGRPARRARDWSLGILFHLAYGIGWGCAFGLARRWTGIPSPLLGGATGMVVYVLAFSGIGVATHTQTEDRPSRRSWRKQVSLIVVAWTFAMCTAAVYDLVAQRAAPKERVERP